MRTVLIGEGALALRCLQSLSARGLTPVLMCSPDGSLQAVAERAGVRHTRDRGEWSSLLAREGCDVLFSVRNPWILSERDLACVQGQAFNFHDSPLPSYAGMHATSWALLNGETQHGITWHEVTSGIDTGRIAVQVRLPVEADETAFTLNTRCFDAAAGAFEQLLEELLTDRLTLQPQSGERSYFGARVRPSSQGVIDFQASAMSVVNLVRALDLGLAPNPLGLPKVWLGREFMVVRHARVCRQASGAPPGTLLEASVDAIRVATALGDVALSGLSRVCGQPFEEGVAPMLSNKVGAVLPSLDRATRARATALIEKVCLQEARWVPALAAGLAPAAHPCVPQGAMASGRSLALVRVSEALAAVPQARRRSHALATLVLYMARLQRDAVLDLGLVCGEAMRVAAPLFAPVVPWRVSYAPDQSFHDFEAQLGDSFQQVSAMGTFALDLLARALPGSGGQVLPGRWPQALLLGEEVPEGIETHAALVWSLSPDGNRATLYAGQEVPEHVVASVDAHWATLIQSGMANPDGAVSRLALLDPIERERLLVGWNNTATSIPAQGVHELFAQQVQRTPDAPAARFGAEVWTYAELDQRANQLAHALVGRGVWPGDLVALSVRRSLDVLVGMLGILKSGAAYVPIDADYPRERIEMMLAQCRPRLVVTHAQTRSSLAFHEGLILCLDEQASMLDEQPRGAPVVQVSPDDRAYGIFTSGSTGTPKCVEIAHRSLVNLALAMVPNYGLGAGSRVLCSASISFDVAAEQIYPALISGAEVVIRPDDLFESFERFDRFVRACGITALVLPTAFWHEWVRYLATRERVVPASLRVIGVGTEKALGEHFVLWRELGGSGVRFLHGYGPTEATITSTMYVHEASHALDPTRPLPIGRPLPNTEIYVLDEAGEPVPVGVEGQIHVGGVGLARGYLRREDLTSQSFVPHPFSQTPGARLYKTGDIGRFEPDGQLVYIGRADFQVKVRGHRVELGEIEAVLRLHPGVSEAVVVVREDVPGARRLAAYVVGLGASGAAEQASMERLCRERLPDYMVPAAFVALEQFPLNINGKVDRRALPVPQVAPKVPMGSASASCQDDIEVIVAQVFAQVLGMARVPLDESFFELGGDSLSAMGMLEELEAALAVSLALTDLFNAPSVLKLAERIRSGSEGDRPLVIQLRQGEGVPVWLVAGVLHYVPLARALKGNSPVYAMLLPAEAALLREGTPLPPVKALAERYTELIRQRTPEGPYVIGGFSFGGAVAYEVAQCLKRQGCEVRLLALFDTVLPGAIQRGVMAWLARQKNAWANEGLQELLDRGKRLLTRRRDAQAQAAQIEQHRHGLMLADFARVLREFEQGMGPYEGSAVLYHSRGEDAWRSVARDHGFGRFIRGGWAVREMDGDHLSMMAEGHVDALAQDLSDRIAAFGAVVLSLETRRQARRAGQQQRQAAQEAAAGRAAG